MSCWASGQVGGLLAGGIFVRGLSGGQPCASRCPLDIMPAMPMLLFSSLALSMAVLPLGKTA